MLGEYWPPESNWYGQLVWDLGAVFSGFRQLAQHMSILAMELPRPKLRGSHDWATMSHLVGHKVDLSVKQDMAKI